MNHGLSENVVKKIADVLSHFPPVKKAVLFGSRAKATHKRGSDIDLALVGAELDRRTLGRIHEALDDLLLPYRFSLLIYDGKTDREVAEHIRRVGSVFYKRESSPAAAQG